MSLGDHLRELRRRVLIAGAAVWYFTKSSTKPVPAVVGLKIDAAVTNAAAVVRLREEGGLDALVWSFAPATHEPPRTLAQVPASSPASVALAAALKRHGFVFVGPTTMYAAMQACGLVDDHLAGCHRASP